MSLETFPRNPSSLPEIIQGGMGIDVSSWTLARAVAAEGEMGVFSGTGIGFVLARRLQDGDPGGHIRAALADFPDQNMVDEMLDEKTGYFSPNGRNGERYKSVPKFDADPDPKIEKLNILGAYAWAKMSRPANGRGKIGMNLLTKVEQPTMSALFGAMLGGVDMVVMGAGIPREIPGILDSFAANEIARMSLTVENAKLNHEMVFDAGEKYPALADIILARPQFLAIVTSHILAIHLARSEKSVPNGYVVEYPNAGGHNAPPRQKNVFTEDGQPVYGPKDEPDLDKMMSDTGLPVWLAGGYGTRGSLQRALDLGANGIQTGTAFALCEDSGMMRSLRRELIRRALSGDKIVVRTDAVSSPTGYPFKIVQHEGTLSDAAVTEKRSRVCDLGYLRTIYVKGRIVDANGEVVEETLGHKCPAGPVHHFVRDSTDKTANPITEEEAIAQTKGRNCTCNGLTGVIGIPQVRPRGTVEPTIITLGDDAQIVVEQLATLERPDYTVKDVLNHLRAVI